MGDSEKLDDMRGGKKPVKRWKLLSILILLFLIFIIGGYGAITYTNTSTFCKSCHEMTPEYVTYSQSSHNQVSCVQCHVKPGLKGLIESKIFLITEVYEHFNNKPKQIVETKEFAISNKNCLQCHTKNRLVTVSGDLKVNHKGHIEKGIPCVICHAGVVHSKIAERTINTSKDLGLWNKENAGKLMEEKYEAPIMGTCIDCHNKVNNGEQPWKDINYSVPANPREKARSSNEINTLTETSGGSQNTQNQQDSNTKEIILEATNRSTKHVKISMSCETCHRKIKVPASHHNTQWDVNHGTTAMQEIDKCINCHQDSKWAKEVPNEDITELLSPAAKKEIYTSNYEKVKELSRANKFCSTCHSYPPPSHSESNVWTLGHAYASINDSDKLECYICHDKEKPKKTAVNDIKAPTDVYCENCHKNGISNVLNGRPGY